MLKINFKFDLLFDKNMHAQARAAQAQHVNCLCTKLRDPGV